MELARSSILHQSAVEAIEGLKRERDSWNATPYSKRQAVNSIKHVKEGKPFPRESQVHYLSRRCWELTEAIYAMQLQHAKDPLPNFEIEIDRLKNHLENARTLLGKPDIRVTVNNSITLDFTLALISIP